MYRSAQRMNIWRTWTCKTISNGGVTKNQFNNNNHENIETEKTSSMVDDYPLDQDTTTMGFYDHCK